MNLHELKNFLILAEQLHFGKASQLCNLSPSALTRSIQRIEESTAQELFFRDNRSVALTPAGEKFRTYAVNAVRSWENLCEVIKEKDTISGSVSIYASVTAVYSLLPNLLESYRATYPNVQLDLRTGSAEQAIQQILDGDIDLAVAALPDKKHPRLKFKPLTETELVFVGIAKNSHEKIDLRTTPLVLPRTGLSRRRLDQYLKTQGITPNINTEVSGNEGILAMVRLGCGIGIVPELVLERSPFRNDLRKITSAPQLAPYIVGLCSTHQNLKRPSISALWEMVNPEI
ncbi:MAG: HTH-type transcriptional activator IlvY [Akkermansiaceae bacterium]